ncbi:MAG: UDP-N-acetylmuramoyl-L-alanyl-D-glutamate--2,6-diaminopimelate ligase [Planctomycetaceae bacterium]|nr:UDP-N-acetylmuramoyl-L-alanyl-D-glutamate--2,6-diaminopimelate ligase [Planctomycetales bacterium]MCB9925103.1 UDP-N-acetylmuramoyl-L-alanyl-D-glutamate--2,6-diaminopimelate ligase [Planctomycetaceae bacterium]
MQPTLERAGRVSLRELIPQGRFFGSDDIRFESCCGDAYRCEPGDLFIAFDGPDGDGHELYREAVERGASAIIAERPLPVSIPVCVVPDTRQAYGHICQLLAGRPGSSMNVIGVTGTNGKTTTSMLIASILNAAESRVGVISTLGRSDSQQTVPAPRTTPVPPEMASWLKRMSSNGCSHAVLELSSHALSQHYTAGMRFDAAVLTNLRRDHVDVHGSVMNYRKTKARLFEQLKPDGFCVVNADDPGSQAILPKLNAPVITVGQREQAEVMANVIERHPSEQTFLLLAGNETVPVRTQMIGDHHVSNCLAAAAVGLVMGIDLATVARGLEAVAQIPGRMQRVECGQRFGVYVDSADNPDRLAIALKTLRKVTSGRIICVFGTPEHRPVDDRPMMGRVVERAADLGILTGAHVPHAQPLQILHDVLDGYDRPARAHLIPTRAQAIQWALEQAKPGDCVLIAGEGRSGIVSHRGKAGTLADYEIARSWLYETARTEPSYSCFN